MPNILFQNYLFNDAGAAIVGATVDLLDIGTTTPVRATTTTDAAGLWTISHATEGRFDVRITNESSIRWHKYAAQLQMDTVEVANLQVRNPADTFKYNIVPAAIVADRQLNLPLITATDTLGALGLAQTWTAVETFVAPVLGAASATSLATSAATPLLMTNGQLVNVALTSQTVGATTLTIPDFASVVDEFTFKTKAQTMSNKTFVAPALGTPASGVVTNLTGTASININGTVGATTPAAATVTTLSMNNQVSWSAGAAVTAGSYQVGRDADATNQLHFNVPTGATFEFSVNDVVEAVLSATNLALGTNTVTAAGVLANSNDSGAIGASGTAFSDLFLASGGVINWSAGTVTITQSGANLTINAASSINLGGQVLPTVDATLPLGSSTLRWTGMFLSASGVIDFNAGDITLTQSANTLTLAGGNLALGVNSLTMTGTIAATGARVTQSYHTNITSTNAVTVDSSETVKHDIEPYAGDALATVMGMDVITFKHDAWLDPSERVKLGIRAESVGEPLAVDRIEREGGSYPGVNLYGQIALLTRALQQMNLRLDRALPAG